MWNMKSDSIMFLISLFFSLVWLVIKDVTSSNMIGLSLMRYIPILILYVKYFKWTFTAIIPALFMLAMFALYLFSGYEYSLAGIIVTGMVPTYLYIVNRVKLSHNQISLVALLSLLALAFYVLLSYNNNRINPNQVGFTDLILTVILLFCLLLYYANSAKRNIFISFLLAVCLFLILHTESRNSLIIFILVISSYYFKDKFTNYLRLLLLVILIVYILYPWVYCQMANNYTFRTANDTNFMGQDVFSGRHIIWNYIFKQLQYPMTFLFGGIDTEWWGKSVHNSALDIVTRYGVPTTLVLFLIIIFYFRESLALISEKYKSLIIVILVTMIWGVNESGLLLGYSYFLFLPLCLIRSKCIIPHRSR